MLSRVLEKVGNQQSKIIPPFRFVPDTSVLEKSEGATWKTAGTTTWQSQSSWITKNSRTPGTKCP